MLAAARILLLIVVFLPLAAAMISPLFGRMVRRTSLWIALVHMLVTIALLAIVVPSLYFRSDYEGRYESRDPIRMKPEFVPGDTDDNPLAPNRTSWTLLNLASSSPSKAGPKIQFYIGLDGFNVWLVALASVMFIVSLLVSWESIQDRPGAYYGWLFLLQGGAIGAFVSFDVILFYVFFELTLVPAFFLIGGWGGGSGRRDAARKFFLYTLAGSLLTLVGIVGIVLTNPNPETGVITFSLPDLMGNVQARLDNAYNDAQAGHPEQLAELLQAQKWFFWALMAGFLVKVPIWPFHTWLPSAYNESPIGVTVLLTSLLAKLGTFGILRFVLTLTPDAALTNGLPVVGWLAAVGIVYGAFCAYNQSDMKLTIAYSSVSHLGFLVLGLFAFNREGLSGSVLHMVNHGLSTGALFALLAFLLDRYRTTQVARFGGLMGRFPNYAVLFFFMALAAIGLPGLNNFVSEMLILAGLYNARNPDLHSLAPAVIAAIGILLSAWYVLTMLQRVFFNPLNEPEPVQSPAPDVNLREGVAFGSLAVLCLALGIIPQYVLDSFKFEVKQLTTVADRARVRAGIPLPVEDYAPPAGAGNEKGASKAGAGGMKGPPGKGGGGGGKGGKGGPKGGKGGPKAGAPSGTGGIGKLIEED